MSQARLIYGSTCRGARLCNMDLFWRISMELPGPHFFVEMGDGFGVRTLLAYGLEIGRAEKEAQNCSVEPWTKYRKKGGLENDGEFAPVVNFLREHGVDSLEVHPDTPAEVFEPLSKEFSISVGSRLWYPERVVKRPEEIERMIKVQRKVEEVFWLVKERLGSASIENGIVVEEGKSLKSETLRAFIEKELYERGCISEHTIAACGAQAADPHSVGLGPVRAGLPIVFDIFPYSRETGYFADMTRTFFKGKPSAQDMWRYNMVLEAQERAIMAIHADVDGQEVDSAARNFLEAKGFRTDFQRGTGFPHSTGHGIGFECHEILVLGRGHCSLPAGAVVTVEPGLYDPELESGIRTEDMGVVEKDGFRNLTNFPKAWKDVVIS